MRATSGFWGNIKLTTAIAGLVLGGIMVTIIAYSVSGYLDLRRQAIRQSVDQQVANLQVAGTILEKRLSGAVLTWAEDGSIAALQAYSLPFFHDTAAIDSVTHITKGAAAIFGLDPASGQFIAKSTSFEGDDGKRIIDFALDPASPEHAALTQGQPYFGDVTMQGTRFFGAFQPMSNLKGELIGAFFVGSDAKIAETAADATLGSTALLGLVLLLVLGTISLVATRLITRPIPRIAKAMDAIAEGKFDTEVPYLNRGNELGAMARAVDVFRANGLRVSEMTEAEAARIIADRDARQQMMTELQSAFGQVVDAAAAGDFTRQVDTEFPDAELNALARSINALVANFNRGVTGIGAVLGALANTDLRQRMEGDYEGAFATLQSDINAVADKLSEVVGQLRDTSGTLKTATGEILSGANDLSERTTRQAATIEETSAAMEELARTVMRNAEQAGKASSVAATVMQAAEEGGQVMEQATLAMSRISDSSGKISNIIGLIDDIAFQTNLLALNASVEAARAGDAGKGFAVVAVEVRRLAQSAANASSEVKLLIEQSASEVRGGTALVGDAAGKIEAVLDASRSSSELMRGIATDSREQAGAIDQVSIAVRTMDEMTQHNAALVEEINAAIEQTESQATALDLIVDVFAVADERAATRRAPLQAARPASAAVRKPVPMSHGNAALDSDWTAF
ncbi:methyl-accepting chemotaxis protein [Devosia aquimaris]|uniref:methyl-accepting chemotaxis protein n=1 Tax=Devosia aquimaris TaxID=2866214 RepID=UPI001CD07287|nr:methyl-accepting chemotaxis protein [Devosia sp. CJK-A8-3]